MHNDQKQNIPTLPILLPTLKLDIPISYDPSESGSITDRVIRKEKERIGDKITVKEYGEPANPPYTVKRFAITPNKNLINKQITTGALHDIEKIAFEEALTELNNSSNPTVLVDIFVRNVEQNKAKIVIKEDPKSLYPEIHTICLWKNDNGTVAIIDPSNTARISYVQEIIKGIFDKVEIQYHNDNSKDNDKSKKTNVKPKQITDDKFYDSGPIVPIGKNEGEARDCIDIAVKIAFVINEILRFSDYKLLLSIKENSANLSTDYKRKISNNIDENIKSLITNNIKKLSNQSINNNLIGSANNGTIIRELQSSDSDIRREVLKLFENNTKLEDSTNTKSEEKVADNPTKYIVVNKLKELQELDALRKSPDSILIEANGSIKAIGKVFLSQLAQLKELHDQIQHFNEKHFTDLHAAFPGLIYFPSYTLQLSLRSTANSNNLTETEMDKYFASLNCAIREQKTDLANQILTKFLVKPDTMPKVLNSALSKGYTDIAKIFIAQMDPAGIALSAKENNNYTSLHMAVHSNNHKIVEYLLQRNSEQSFVNAQDSNGHTALHWAAGQGYTEIVETLVKKMDSASIALPAKENNNYTSLHMAVHSNNCEIVKYLLDKNSDSSFVNAQDSNGQIALHWAAGKGYKDICSLLLDNMKPEDISINTGLHDYTVLHMAIHCGDPELVKLIIDKAPNIINIQDAFGLTGLHWAAGKGYKDICSLLLDNMKPEDVQLKTRLGQTLFHFVVQNNSQQSVELLNYFLNEDKTKNLINEVDAEGRTPLYYACLKRCTDICDKILDKISKDDLIIQNTSKDTALHAICMSFSKGDINAIKIIIEKMINKNPNIINIANKFGQKPLHYAMLKQDLEICQILWSKEIGQNPTLNKIIELIDKSYPEEVGGWPKAIQTFYEDKIYPLYSSHNEPYEPQENIEAITLLQNITEESLLFDEANKVTPKANPYHNTEVVNFLAEQNSKSNDSNNEEAFASNNTDTEPSSNVSTYAIRINSEILAGENPQSSPLAEYNIVDKLATTKITSEDPATSPYLENKSFTEEQLEDLFYYTANFMAEEDINKIQPLLNQNVDPFATDEWGTSAFSIALRQGNVDLAKKFIESKKFDYNPPIIQELLQEAEELKFYQTVALSVCRKDSTLRDLLGFDKLGAQICFIDAKESFEAVTSGTIDSSFLFNDNDLF